jgi:hypothetical protein
MDETSIGNGTQTLKIKKRELSSQAGLIGYNRGIQATSKG